MKWTHAAVIAVPLIALGELAAHFYFAKRPPSIEQWRGLAPTVASMRQPGELVVVAPQWAEPMARLAFGDDLMPLRDVARPDESGYASAVEVSIIGQRSPLLRDWQTVEERSVGKFVLRRVKNARHTPVLFDFVDHLGPNGVTASLHDGQEKPCSWTDNAQAIAGGLGGAPTFPSRRFTCPAPAHIFVGTTVVEDQNYLPRRCIMMHAPAHGHLEARFRDVPIGREMRGHTGLRWVIERDGEGAPMTLEVFINGEKAGQDVHEDGQGWKGWRIDTSAKAGSTAEVTFRVSAPVESGRQMCWEASTR